MHDVIVVGAGPAGSEAAFRLASLGYDVLVLEKDKLDREKPCGGAIQGIELEQFGRPPFEIIERKISVAKFFDYKGNILSAPLNPYGITVRRSKYDRWLQTKAEKKGAEFFENAEVKKVHLGDMPEVCLSKESKRFVCRLVIDASGTTSVVRKSVNSSKTPNEYGVAIQKWFLLSDNEIRERVGNCCEFYLDSSIIPIGYAWIFPKKGALAVGLGTTVGTLREKKINIKKCLDRFVNKHQIARRKLEGTSEICVQSAIVPMKIQFPLHFKNTLLLGDAAGLVNPLHGGGIYPARLSAKFAAECAHEYLQSNEGGILAKYDMIIQESMWEENYKWSLLMRSFLFDDALVSDTISNGCSVEVKQALSDMLMFYNHKETYKHLRKSLLATFSRVYPLTASEVSSNLIVIPRNSNSYDFSFNAGETLVAVSYCIKSFECPKGRFSTECDENCGLCDMSRLKKTSNEMGFDFRIATDDDRFIEFLEDNFEKYKSLIGVVCPYTTNKIGYAVHKIFGLNGVVIPLQGDVCTSEDKYMKGVKGEKANQTKTDLQTFFDIMNRIAKTN